MNKIKFKDVCFAYGENEILKNISFSYDFSEFLSIFGPNGSGKSTILKLILGILKPTSGEISRENLTQIGYVPQQIPLNRSFPISVLEVVLMGRIDKKRFFGYSNEDKNLALDALKKVGMSEFGAKKISDLSGGQRQRVYIARALCSDAKILILDEPLASIDANGQVQIYSLLKELNRAGIGIIMVSHDINIAINFATKAIYAANGQITMHEITQKSDFINHLASHHNHFCDIELMLGECECQKS